MGGLIGGLPSTVVIALLFIGLTQSPQIAADTTTVMPLAQGLNGLFVLTFMRLDSPWVMGGFAECIIPLVLPIHPPLPVGYSIILDFIGWLADSACFCYTCC